MSVAKDIAQILDDDLDAELGVDLFISQMPESPNAVIAVYETGGGAYDAMSELHSAGISVRARAVDYEAAYIAICDVADVLAPIGDENYFQTGLNVGVTVNGTNYLRVKPESEPYPVGRDSQERVEFAQNFTVTFFKND